MVFDKSICFVGRLDDKKSTCDDVWKKAYDLIGLENSLLTSRISIFFYAQAAMFTAFYYVVFKSDRIDKSIAVLLYISTYVVGLLSTRITKKVINSHLSQIASCGIWLEKASKKETYLAKFPHPVIMFCPSVKKNYPQDYLDAGEAAVVKKYNFGINWLFNTLYAVWTAIFIVWGLKVFWSMILSTPCYYCFFCVYDC